MTLGNARKQKLILQLRTKLKNSKPSIGTWIQIPSTSSAEIISNAGYDWVCVDMEHGEISRSEIPNLFRSIELGGSLPFARLIESKIGNAKFALESGASGLIFPKIEDADQLSELIDSCYLPPHGSRGVGFSRSNLFGEFFTDYIKDPIKPIIVAMIESVKGVKNLHKILEVSGLDAILIGPYDLSASLGDAGNFSTEAFKENVNIIKDLTKKKSIALGSHIVNPEIDELNSKISAGYTFIAYSIDTVFLRIASTFPLSK